MSDFVLTDPSDLNCCRAERILAAFEAAPIAFFVLDDMRCVLACNAQARALAREGLGRFCTGAARLSDRAADEWLSTTAPPSRFAWSAGHGQWARAELAALASPSCGFLLLIVRVARACPSLDPTVLRRAFSLTVAEADVLTGLVAGQAVSVIAQRRGVKVETVRGQVKACLAKLGVRTRLAAARLAWDLME